MADQLKKEYQSKCHTAEEAIQKIHSGNRIFIGSACGEPQHLVNALVKQADRFSDLEIVRLMSSQISPISLIANESKGHNFTIRSIYQGSAMSPKIAEYKRFIAPMNLFSVPSLFKKKHLPLHAALIQVSPPDDFGWMSLGVSVDVTLAASQSSDIVIAQINPKMPRILGHGFIHLNEVDMIVEHEENIFSIEPLKEFESAHTIAQLLAHLIDDGATFQMGLGNTPQGIMLALAEKNDLGVHSQFFIDGMMDLVKKGVITNKYKGLNDGKLVASSAVGSQDLYAFLNNNPSVEFYPSDYVNNPSIIARHNKMVTINVAKAIDLTGQVAADVLPLDHYTGVTGVLDFVRGAAAAPGGKSIILLPSTQSRGEISHIVASLESTSVVVPRSDVQYVISEFGAVNLFGKNLQERAMAMISLAHPDYRQQLLDQAKELGLMGKERTLSEFVKGIYPAKMEESRMYGNEKVTFRAAKPVDDRRVQEHFYNMNPEDIQSRFFHEKSCFFRDDMEEMFQIDYIKDMTVVAVTGEFGFGKVIGMGAYLAEQGGGIAEVAFSVAQDWQGRGIAAVLMDKLHQAAKDNKISGFIAYTNRTNKGMIKLFDKLPYSVNKTHEDDLTVLSCQFIEKEDLEPSQD